MCKYKKNLLINTSKNQKLKKLISLKNLEVQSIDALMVRNTSARNAKLKFLEGILLV